MSNDLEIELLKKEVSKVNSENFDELALAVFHYQYNHCMPYKSYINNLNINPKIITKSEKIPFLPISFFKTQKVICEEVIIETVFESSGTTGQNTSSHFISDTNFYQNHSLKIFENAYGKISDFHIIALLPSYLEKGNSSLVFMIKHFIEQSDSEFSGFFLSDYQNIIDTFIKIKSSSQNNRKILLWGVTYALLDLLEIGFDFSEFKNRLIVMETGGMKGRRKEMVKEELYSILKKGFSINEIHSEYGMTELLSQAYSHNDALFQCPSSMKILLREINDPFTLIEAKNIKKTGGINVIDLANITSCSFIETQDLGQFANEMGQFKVLGRFDNSDIRGCNLLAN